MGCGVSSKALAITIKGDPEPYCDVLDSLDDRRLVLMYLPRGNFLTYERIPKWSVRNLGTKSSAAFTTFSQFEIGRQMRDSTAQKFIAAFGAYNVEITNGAGAFCKHETHVADPIV